VAKLSNVLGQRLRALRAERDVTLKGLARRLDVDPSFLGRMERGIVAAPESVVRAIASELEVAAEPLLVLAGHLPEDIQQMFRRQPERALAVLRGALGKRGARVEAP
jgi:transcriptional regulator with XRE-family HTH domain